LECWRDKKRTLTLCGLDCTILYHLPVLFLHYEQTCICTPQGIILALLHCKGSVSGGDQYFCAYLKPCFPFKMVFVFGISLSMRKAFKIFLCIYVFFQVYDEKSKIVHRAVQQGLRVISKGMHH